MGAAVWSGLQACMERTEEDSGHNTTIVPDTGSTPYTPTTLPLLDLTDEVWEVLEAWTIMQAGNGEPGEGSPEWEDFIRFLAEIHPEAVVSESESEES